MWKCLDLAIPVDIKLQLIQIPIALFLSKWEIPEVYGIILGAFLALELPLVIVVESELCYGLIKLINPPRQVL